MTTSTDDLLTHAAQLLEQAAYGTGPLRKAANALRSLLAAADRPNPTAVSRESCERLEAAIRDATPIVAEASRPILAAERVYFAMGAACSVAGMLGRPLNELQAAGHTLATTLDRLDHTALLANDLDSLQRRREIGSRGDVLRSDVVRRVQANAAVAA
jgi:hypothetical protein